MTRDVFKGMLEEIARSWVRRDYQTAALFFADNVRYADPLRYRFDNRRNRGKFFEEDGGCEQKCEWRNIIFDESQGIGAVEYTYEGTHRYHGVALVKVANGKITHWREYQHTSESNWQEFCSGTSF